MKWFKKMAATYKDTAKRLRDIDRDPDEFERLDPAMRAFLPFAGLVGVLVALFPVFVVAVIVALCSQGCAGPAKLQRVQAEEMRASIGVIDSPVKPVNDDNGTRNDEGGSRREGQLTLNSPRPDTLVVRDDEGREMIIMRAIKDENGEMVATDVIQAAYVEARFRNVAERRGRVDIAFQIRVPQGMQDESWQLRFYPVMRLMDDELPLEPVIITGAKYRKAQLRGYQQYEKYLAGIVTDSTRFINLRLLELFIQRNIPELYAFKNDTTEVEAAAFERVLDKEVASSYASQFGVTGRDAIEHYTNSISKRRNARRWEQREEMYRKYVKSPIVREGIRLDTVITAANGDFLYNYVQTIHTRPKLRKVDVVLSGDIFEQEKRLYEIPETEPLTYYISSLSAFVDDTPRYRKHIISRRVEANTACYIDFEQGSAEIVEDMSHNRFEMGRIKENLGSLIENREFDLDSIVVTASCSPEGTVAFNTRLSQRRSEAVSRYFSGFIRAYQDSLRQAKLSLIYFDGMGEEQIPGLDQDMGEIKFISRNNPENWRALDVLVAESDSLTTDQKREYAELGAIEDADAREAALAGKPYYRFLREILYPRLRTVKFDFHLHRKDMVQDTLVTTVLDDVYMDGVQAIRDRDYERAIVVLRPYQDYNAAVAFTAMDYNASALAILEALPSSDQVDYLLAVIYSRQGKDQEAVEHYLRACRMNQSLVHRGNLDPEISELIKRYNLINQLSNI